jgi:hypothetical protein
MQNTGKMLNYCWNKGLHESICSGLQRKRTPAIAGIILFWATHTLSRWWEPPQITIEHRIWLWTYEKYTCLKRLAEIFFSILWRGNKHNVVTLSTRIHGISQVNTQKSSFFSSFNNLIVDLNLWFNNISIVWCVWTCSIFVFAAFNLKILFLAKFTTASI